jgi:hypothetical protein
LRYLAAVMHCSLRTSALLSFLIAAGCGSSTGSTGSAGDATPSPASDGPVPDGAAAVTDLGLTDAAIASDAREGDSLLTDNADAPPELPSDSAIDRPPFIFPDVLIHNDVSPRPERPIFPPPLVDAMASTPPSPDVTSLVPGRARLVGSHFSACSNALLASGNGDRWCAFSLPNRQIGLTDLWVIDVTKALAGTPPKCDGTDPNCKLLIPPGSSAVMGTQLWTGQPMQGPIHPTTHRFDGDTLIFHALAPENVDQYAGPIFAWRPGWDAPKQISLGKTAYSCSGHGSAEVFVCIENLSSTDPLVFDLTGGQLATGPKLIKHIVPFRAGTQTSQWRAALSRDGQFLAFSTGGLTLAERETLFVTNLSTADQPTMVGTPGISRWSISGDSKHYYYLRNYNYDSAGAPSGTMTMADFPTGANEVTLAPAVGAVVPLSDGDVDKGVAFFDNVLASKATFKYMADPKTKATVTVVNNIGGTLGVTRDLKLLYYYKDVNPDNGTTTDGYIAKMDGTDVGTGGCALTTQTNSDQFGAPFTKNGSIVMWADNIDPVDGVGEGWWANPAGCTEKHKFADKIDFWFLKDSDGMVYSDQGLADFATLKFATFPGGTSVTFPGTVIQDHVNRIYGIVGNFQALVFTIVGSPPDSDGLYTWKKLPF